MKPVYLRMVNGMASRGNRRWSVYILRCGDGTLYTGISTDVPRRVDQHNKGKGSAYTRAHRPVALIYQEIGFTRAQALVREAKIKRFDRQKKEALVGNRGPARSLSRKRQSRRAVQHPSRQGAGKFYGV